MTLIDIGLGSLICNPAKIFPTAFGRIYRKQLQDCIESVYPGWLSKWVDRQTYQSIRTGRSYEFMDVLVENGISRPAHFFDSKVAVQTPLSSYLIRGIDAIRVNQISKTQTDHNALACNLFKKVMGLMDEDHVILFRSKKDALLLAASILSESGKESLNWRVSALSTNYNVLSQVMLDCDEIGGLALSNFKASPTLITGVLYNYDGGSISPWAKMRNHCERLGVPLIVKNSNGLQDRPLTHRSEKEIEVLACDVSKPWGAGEAVALILSNKQRLVADRILKDEQLLPDQVCFELLDVLERYQRFSFFYKRQTRRIQQLVARNVPNLKAWPDGNTQKSPSGNLHYICKTQVLESNLRNELFEIQKPYSGISSEYENAKRLGDHIISIPCHPMMRHVSNNDIVETLKAAINTGARGHAAEL